MNQAIKVILRPTKDDNILDGNLDDREHTLYLYSQHVTHIWDPSGCEHMAH